KKQLEALQAQADEARKREMDGVVQRIKDAIKEYGLSAQDLGFGTARQPRQSAAPADRKAGRKSAKRAGGAAYRDEDGNTWGGRGPRPAWLRNALASGRTLEEFRV
ncbi:MAG TPA: H-NS histone family protein, partial [Burkholderiaceae bacterium]|nr:H-NS histone family protein [Burkholderiaceae bacterium]